MRKNIILIILVLLLFPITVSAHPGNTASDGCHYCRTNCDKWGEVWNARHCHGGGSAVIYELPSNTPIPLPTWTQAPTWTPRPTNTLIPTRTPTPSITLTPTITLTPSITQTPLPTKKLTITPTSVPEVKGQSIGGGFWGWIFGFFGLK